MNTTVSKQSNNLTNKSANKETNLQIPEEFTEAMSLIKKGTVEIHNEDELLSKLIQSKKNGQPLVVKLGLDPTAPDLHLGHTVVLRKIRQLQNLGHKAFLIIGDFTGRIGDPSGKVKSRPQLTKEEVLINAETYREQLGQVLDPEKTTICFNSEWLDAMKPSELLEIMSRHTVARILERDSFKKRLKAGQPIGLHELVYPLLQGLDSVNIDADIELGGLDQKFNILTGREMQGKAGKEKQVAIFMPIIEGLDGKDKMGKTAGNFIGITEEPNVMFQKVMTVKDHLIIKYFNLLTDLTPSQISGVVAQLTEESTNPKIVKLRLAWEIVRLYHSEKAANVAQKAFEHIFTNGQIPEDILSFKWDKDDSLMSFLTKNKVVESRSEVRRLVQQRGVKVNDQVILEPEVIGLCSGDVIRIGKKRFVKVA